MQTLSLEDYLQDVNRVSDHVDTVLGFISITKKLPPFSKDGPWLVGGTVRRLIAAEELTTDWDIMFKNESQFDNYCGWLRERGAEPIRETTHQITFNYLGKEIQAIKASYSDTLIQTLNKFDFTICQFGFDGINFVWSDDAGLHLKEKKLVFTDTNDPIATFRRAFKYAAQGFFMDTDSIAKFLRAAGSDEKKLQAAEVKWTKADEVDVSSFEGQILSKEVLQEIARRFQEQLQWRGGIVTNSRPYIIGQDSASFPAQFVMSSQKYGGSSFAP